MAATRSVMTSARIGLLALALARCSEPGNPTSWIPHDGAISGVITVTAGFPAPPRTGAASAARRAVDGSTLALPARPRPAPFALRMRAAVARTRPAPALRAALTAHDLIITFRPTALGAPPVGSPALATAAGARTFGRAIHSRLAVIVPAGAAVVGVSPAILAARVRVADTARREAVAAALRRDPSVAAVTRNHIIWLDERRHAAVRTAGVAAVSRKIPNDEGYPFQAWNYGLIDLPLAWSITTGSAAVLVAVVDDGIRRDHPDITANLTADGYDFVNAADSLPLCAGDTISNDGDGDAGPDPDPNIPASYSVDSTGTCFIPDDFGAHGLHVAGTIGAVGNDGLGVNGVAWTVRIRPVRAVGVDGFGTDYDIAQGILYAAGLPADAGALGTVQASSGARVINLSLGGSDDDSTLHSAIISAAGAGALIVAAAGNESSSAPEYPAAYPEVLSVAAVGPDGLPAPYSSFGSSVGIRAPGGNFELGDVTDGVFSLGWEFVPTPGFPVGPVYVIAEGTSMATPHVSGVAALLLAQNSSLTAAALRSRLTSYAVGPATAYGAGLVDAYNSLTQSAGPPTQLYARLSSAITGATVQTVAAQAGGAFAFSGVEDGTYFVYGGTDEGGDQRLGIPGRLWGAFGGLAVPSTVTVFGTAAHPASLSVGYPSALGPNHTLATASPLAIGGYAQGVVVDTLTLDVYRVRVFETGTYTFETSGWVGACGFALEAATAILVLDVTGTLLKSTDFIDPGHNNYCSRLTRTLTAGTYYVAVGGYFFNGGRYRLQARAGT